LLSDSWARRHIGLIAAAWCLTAMPAGGQTPAPQTTESLVTHMVLGIASFTRWPIPPSVYRLCLLGESRWSSGLLGPLLEVHQRPVVASRLAGLDDPGLTQCDIIYSGPLTEDQLRTLSDRLAGHAVLTISESNPQCRIGSMFCLTVGDGPVAFAVNLDNVARGGIRVSPSVLQLGRSQPKPQP
jgi:hypothetical protein